jgi:hypothetical protein
MRYSPLRGWQSALPRQPFPKSKIRLIQKCVSRSER